jgi:hypothetical protein
MVWANIDIPTRTFTIHGDAECGRMLERGAIPLKRLDKPSEFFWFKRKQSFRVLNQATDSHAQLNSLFFYSLPLRFSTF